MGTKVSGDDKPRRLVVGVLPTSYLGAVYALLTSSEPSDVAVELDWGPWRYARTVMVDKRSTALLFSKTEMGEDQPPLRVTTDKPVVIGIYTGLPEEGHTLVVDCNDGWERR